MLDAPGIGDAPHALRGSIALWDLDKGIVKVPPFDNKSEGGSSLAFSPNGRYLAVYGCDGSLSLWDLQGSKPARHELFKYPVRRWPANARLAFSHDSKLLATDGDVGSLSIWDVENEKALDQKLPISEASLNSLAFDPFDEMLASGYGDGSIILWYYKEPAPRDTGNRAPCKEEGAKTETAGENTQDPKPPANRIVLCYGVEDPGVGYHPVRAIGFIDKSHIFAVSGGKEIFFWKLGDRNASPPDSLFEDDPTQSQIVNYFLLKGHDEIFNSVSFSPDYMNYITGASDGTAVFWKSLEANIYQLAENMSAEFPSAFHHPTTVVADPDARRHGFAVGTQKGEILFWDSSRRREFRPPLQTQDSPVVQLAYDRDGKKLASVNENGQVTIWDLENSQPLRTFALPQRFQIVDTLQPMPYAKKDVVFDSQLKIFATASSVLGSEIGALDNVGILLFDTTGKQLSRLDFVIKRDYVGTFRMAFSPGGKRLAVSNENISLWDVSNPRKPSKLKETEHYSDSWIGPLTFSHDGTLLATASNTGRVTIRSVDTLEPNGRSLYWPGAMPGSPVRKSGSSMLVFSPDDKTLASGGEKEEVIYFWDVGSRLFLGEIRTGIRLPTISSISFTSDNSGLATIFDEPNGPYLALWKLDLKTLKTTARHIANRNLTPEEKEK